MGEDGMEPSEFVEAGKDQAVFPSGQIGRPIICRSIDRSGLATFRKAVLGIDRPGLVLRLLRHL